MNLTRPKCPECKEHISFVEVKKTFLCPHCGAELKSSGQGKIMLFEIAAFIVLGWLLAAFIVHERYLGAGMILAGWIVAEYWARNSMPVVSRASREGEHCS